MVFDIKKAGESVDGANVNGDHVNGDTNGVTDENGPGGKYGYRIGHSKNGYAIPDVVLNSTEHRRVKVITIGAGVSGILMAYLIQKQCENVEHVIYEKNGDIGGTWLEVWCESMRTHRGDTRRPSPVFMLLTARTG